MWEPGGLQETDGNPKTKGRQSPAAAQESRVLSQLTNLDFLSGETRPAMSAHSCEGINGLARKCHPSLSTSIPSANPDISNTRRLGRSTLILVANSTPDIPGIWKSDRRR